MSVERTESGHLGWKKVRKNTFPHINAKTNTESKNLNSQASDLGPKHYKLFYQVRKTP